MLYKEKQIGTKPSIDMCQELVDRMGFTNFNADEFYNYYQERNWLTSKGEEPQSLEALINAYNGKIIQEKRKNGETVEKRDVGIRKQMSLEYNHLLKDKRWWRKRFEIMQRDNWKCSICGADYETSELNVHHKIYHQGLMPWEYNDEDLITLCSECHKKEHNITY